MAPECFPAIALPTPLRPRVANKIPRQPPQQPHGLVLFTCFLPVLYFLLTLYFLHMLYSLPALYSLLSLYFFTCLVLFTYLVLLPILYFPKAARRFPLATTSTTSQPMGYQYTMALSPLKDKPSERLAVAASAEKADCSPADYKSSEEGPPATFFSPSLLGSRLGSLPGPVGLGPFLPIRSRRNLRRLRTAPGS